MMRKVYYCTVLVVYLLIWAHVCFGQPVNIRTETDPLAIHKDGTVALTANWDAGSYEVRAQTLESDVATGTAPLTIASTTAVTNLNADLLDGQHGSYYAAADSYLKLDQTTPQTVINGQPVFEDGFKAGTIGISWAFQVDGLGLGFTAEGTGVINAGDLWLTDNPSYVYFGKNPSSLARWQAGYSSPDFKIKANTADAGEISLEPTTVVNVAGNIDTTGTSTASRYISDVADGTSPYSCTSTTLNTNLNADMVDGAHLASLAKVYVDDFANANLSASVLTVTHNLGRKYVSVTIYDDDDKMVIPTAVTLTDTNNLTVSLLGYGTISGTWHVVVIG